MIMQYFKYRSQNGGLLSLPDKYPEQLGDILELKPIQEKTINGIEYGEPAQWSFHEVTQKNGYIYDPMFGSNPVKIRDFMQIYKDMNPGGLNVTNKTQ